jgi:hypothetical protein
MDVPPLLDGARQVSLTAVFAGFAVGDRGAVGIAAAVSTVPERGGSGGTTLSARTCPAAPSEVAIATAARARRARRLTFMFVLFRVGRDSRGTRCDQHDDGRCGTDE